MITRSSLQMTFHVCNRACKEQAEAIDVITSVRAPKRVEIEWQGV